MLYIRKEQKLVYDGQQQLYPKTGFIFIYFLYGVKYDENFFHLTAGWSRNEGLWTEDKHVTVRKDSVQ